LTASLNVADAISFTKGQSHHLKNFMSASQDFFKNLNNSCQQFNSSIAKFRAATLNSFARISHQQMELAGHN
jgi:hypothetical protein